MPRVRVRAAEEGADRAWISDTLTDRWGDAVVVSRDMKPRIPLVGYDGIEVHDEIEVAVTLQ